MVFKAPTFHGGEPQVETDHSTRAALETAVANALAVAGGIDACGVTVSAHEQEITLDGTVGTAEEVARATLVAEAIEGVLAVRNRIVAAAG